MKGPYPKETGVPQALLLPGSFTIHVKGCFLLRSKKVLVTEPLPGSGFCFSFFNWRKIALRYFVDFCHTAVKTSGNYTHLTSLPPLLPSPHPCMSGRALCIIEQPVTSYQSYVWSYGRVYVSIWLSPFIPLSPSLTVFTSLLPISASTFLQPVL